METSPKEFYANKFNALGEIEEDLIGTRMKLLALHRKESMMPGGNVEEINVLIESLQVLLMQIEGHMSALRPLV